MGGLKRWSRKVWWWQVFFISGRIKEIINKGGEKIYSRDWWSADEYEAVFQAVCFSIKHEKLGEDIAAAVVLKEGKTVDEKELRTQHKSIAYSNSEDINSQWNQKATLERYRELVLQKN